MTEQAVTACRRCREQKLKCSRDQPKCARCTRLGFECTYPKPPDRKLLASLRTSGSKRQRLNIPNARDVSPTHEAEKQHEPVEVSATSPRFEVDDVPKNMPTRDVQKLLQDLYFTCAFNSSLTFHRPTFTRMWMENQLPDPLLLAVCAVGTIFLNSDSAKKMPDISNILSRNEIRASARDWALWAGKKILPKVDQPSVIEIQTCGVLAFYWFAAGDSLRNTMFSGIAYRATRALVLDPTRFALIIGSDNLSASERSESDALRKCFWATWLPNHISSDHYVIGSSADSLLMKIPLPNDDDASDRTAQRTYVTLATTDLPHSAVTRNAAIETVSVMAELMRVVLYWTRVRDYIETKRQRSAQQSHADLFALDQELLAWASNLPSSFVYSKRHLYEYVFVKQQPCYVAVHAVFHQCRLVLHSFLVPQFSGLPLQKDISPEVIRTSARIALEMAQAISKLAADFLALEADAAQLGPFVGYCMYVAASVHITFIASKKNDLAAAAMSNMVSSVKILGSMKNLWKSLENLWKRIHLLYEVQIRKISAQNPDLLINDQSTIDEIDNIAYLRRDTGKLAEPLADSVLQYSLRKTQRQIDDRDLDQSSQEFENAMRVDRMIQLTQALFSQSPHVLSASRPNATGPGSLPSSTSQLAVAGSPFLQETYVSPLNLPDPQTFQPYQSTDWWSLDMDMDVFNMPNMQYEDFFGGNLDLGV